MTVSFRSVWPAALALLSAAPASAHDASPRHGGRLAESGAFHMEMVSHGEQLDVFVSDAGGEPVPVAGFKGTAILVVGGRTARVPLAPAGENRLTGRSGTDLGASPRGAVQITTAAGQTASGTFR